MAVGLPEEVLAAEGRASAQGIALQIGRLLQILSITTVLQEMGTELIQAQSTHVVLLAFGNSLMHPGHVTAFSEVLSLFHRTIM
mmetsp:Transcript_115625/g.199848  ORF Transcript_115625/g.199848 Transcript_115625/m.199848 type:complete len:84 (+) Transcript_115625:73-324(+)